MPALLVAPALPVPDTPPPVVRVRTASPHDFSELEDGRITAPPAIPPHIRYTDAPEPGFDHNIATEIGRNGPAGADGENPFSSRRVTVVRPPAASVRLPSRLVESSIIYKTIPQYPAIAKAAHQEGTVILQAMISKSGTIEHLQVMSGPEMLRQAAIDAVKTWRYRPYLLNDQPIEVETTVSVIFKIDR
jgi:protein TonB